MRVLVRVVRQIGDERLTRDLMLPIAPIVGA